MLRSRACARCAPRPRGLAPTCRRARAPTRRAGRPGRRRSARGRSRPRARMRRASSRRPRAREASARGVFGEVRGQPGRVDAHEIGTRGGVRSENLADDLLAAREGHERRLDREVALGHRGVDELGLFGPERVQERDRRRGGRRRRRPATKRRRRDQQQRRRPQRAMYTAARAARRNSDSCRGTRAPIGPRRSARRADPGVASSLGGTRRAALRARVTGLLIQERDPRGELRAAGRARAADLSQLAPAVTAHASPRRIDLVLPTVPCAA